jgi:hypothetical protein
MGQVSASSTAWIDAEPETVLAAVADYQAVRPEILPPHYSDLIRILLDWCRRLGEFDILMGTLAGHDRGDQALHRRRIWR